MTIPGEVKNARYVEGMEQTRWLLVEVDGQDVGIWEQQKLLKHGAVTFLRPPGRPLDYDHHMSYQFFWAADPEDGRPRDEVVDGATADPRIVRLTNQYHRDIRRGSWRPGRRLEVT